MNKSINIVLDIISILILTVLFIYRSHFEHKTKNDYRLFILMMSIVADLLGVDCVSWIVDGFTYMGSQVVSVLLNTIYWFGQIVFCWLWLFYSIYTAIAPEKNFRLMMIFTGIPMMIEVIILIINIRTGWIFKINSSGTYVRGYFYLYNLIFYYGYILVSIGVTIFGAITCKDYYKRKHEVSLLAYLFLPTIGMVIQSFVLNYSIIWPFTTLSVLMIYISNQQESLSYEQISSVLEKEKRAKLEKELLDNRISIMMSQIQPHFLYNSLTTISELCDIDPKLAKQATINFSKYLRGNLDSLKENRPLPFESELKHVQTYLDLEKIRFEDDLKIVYDIKVKDFLFPSLALQPIVENAVKYGICQKEDGGTLTISTYDDEEFIYIVVKDDGIGFEQSNEKKDGRSHIGISNVRNRISNMCHGSLTIESVLNVGTTATIKLPKGDNLL